MTALAGLWRFGDDPGPAAEGEALCRSMLAAQAVYGPDGRAVRDAGEIALGRNLFNLLPEDAVDRQPVEDGDRLLVADLRLDNRDALCAALGVAADAAMRLADSDLLMKAWTRWGEAVFDQLVGDYAFALWDGGTRRLILARDPFGGRPLVWSRGEGFVAFASMPSGLHALPQIARAPDEGFTAEFLALLPEEGPRTFFAGVQRVQPAEVLIFSEAGLVRRRHWDPMRLPRRDWTGRDPVVEVRRVFDEAVRARLRGRAGTIGAHLSGGLDSGGVAATAAAELARRGQGLVAFTSVPHAAFEAPQLDTVFADERTHAAATAALYPNIEHVVVAAPVDGLVAELDPTLDAYQRPFRNPVNICWWNAINADARRRGLKIMLTGEMGNATLSFAGAGYLAESLSRGRLVDLWRGARALRRRGAGWRRILMSALGPWTPDFVWRTMQALRGRSADLARHSTIRAGAVAAFGLEARARALGHDVMFRPPRGGLKGRCSLFQHADPGAYRKGALGAHGIDQRDPTADRRLVELCLSLPTAYFFGEGERRALARRVLADRLPDWVVNEHRKGTQGADRRDRLVSAAAPISALLDALDGCPPAARIVDLERLRSMSARPYEGDPSTEAAEDQALFRGLVVGRFLQTASGRPPSGCDR